MRSLMRIVIVTVAFFTLIAGSAWAACAPSDVAGTWRVFVSSHGTSQTLGWQRCTIDVLASGDIATSSFCRDSDGNRANILGSSRFVLGSTCDISGIIKLGGGVTERIVDGQLSRDKLSMAGVATDPGGPSTFVGIKR